MDKVNFDRERYRLGHTKVFFKAGALAGLEECRDDIVTTLVRHMQGQALGHMRRKVYQQKHDQRELMKVIQRNYRKYFLRHKRKLACVPCNVNTLSGTDKT